MSDDLVTRLRRAVIWNGVVPHGDFLAMEAADDFIRRYRWLPAEPDDRLDWLVMVGAAWVVYALAGVVWMIWRL